MARKGEAGRRLAPWASVSRVRTGEITSGSVFPERSSAELTRHYGCSNSPCSLSGTGSQDRAVPNAVVAREGLTEVAPRRGLLSIRSGQAHLAP